MSNKKTYTSRADYEEILNNAIERDRQAVTQAESVSAQDLQTATRPPTALMTELLDTGVDWQTERVRELLANNNFRDPENVILEYRRRVQESRPEESYPSHRQETIARNTYRPRLQWFANLLATRVLVDELETLEREGRLGPICTGSPARSLTELSSFCRETLTRRRAEANMKATGGKKVPKNNFRDLRMHQTYNGEVDKNGKWRKTSRAVLVPTEATLRRFHRQCSCEIHDQVGL